MRRRLMSNPVVGNKKSSCLTIHALEDNLTVQITDSNFNFEYSINNGEWTPYSDELITPSINSGDTISFKGSLSSKLSEVTSKEGIGTFKISKKCNLSGNCMSMLYGDNASDYTSVPAYAFNHLFHQCDTIVSISDDFLPAVNIGEWSYQAMFSACSSLVKAPKLPATILTTGCYYTMFNECVSLQKAPELLAPTLVSKCYFNMFRYCENLTYIKAMFLTSPDDVSEATTQWTWGVPSNGTFVKNKNANWTTTGADGIPNGWTIITE